MRLEAQSFPALTPISRISRVSRIWVLTSRGGFPVVLSRQIFWSDFFGVTFGFLSQFFGANEKRPSFTDVVFKCQLSTSLLLKVLPIATICISARISTLNMGRPAPFIRAVFVNLSPHLLLSLIYLSSRLRFYETYLHRKHVRSDSALVVRTTSPSFAC
jgi:hypothetical protein